MSKYDIKRNGKLSCRAVRRMIANKEYCQLDAKLRVKEPIRLGPRTQVLHAYEENKNREDAYCIANDINKKIGQEAYPKEIVDQWIDEYEKRKEEMERDGDAR